MGSFTYDISTDRGRCRFLVADTVQANAHFDDAEIDAMLTLHGSVKGAVYELAAHAYAEAVRATSSRSKASAGSSQAVDDTHRAEHWRDIMERYEQFASSASRVPTVNVGVSLTPSADGYE